MHAVSSNRTEPPAESTMSNLTLRLVALCFIAFALFACGPVKRVNPPAATVQRLAIANDALTLDLRLQNHSDIETRFGFIDLDVSIEDTGVGRIEQSAGITAAPHSVEIVTITLPIAGDARAAIDAAVAGGKSLRYRIEGRIETEEPGGDYPLEYESRLSPVPGRPGEYR
jgi:hypothetical protein